MRTVMGVDASSTRLAMIVLEGPTMHTESLALPSDITDACVRAQAWMVEMIAEYKPRLVVLEAPFFHRLHPTGAVPMSQVNGALLAGTGGTNTISVQPSRWKKSVLGIGNASKEIISAWVNTNHPKAAETFVSMKYQQDLTDAFCIALHGLRVLESRAKVLSRT